MSKRAAGKTQLLLQPKVKVLETNFADMKAGQRMVVPTPDLIRNVIEGVPQGQQLSLPALRNLLASRAGTEVACPVTTSLFLRKLVEAEWSKLQTLPAEERDASLKSLLPFWRAIHPKMPLYKKLDPAIQSFVLAQRESEGISISS